MPAEESASGEGSGRINKTDSWPPGIQKISHGTPLTLLLQASAAAPAIPKPTTTKPKPATSKPTPRQSLARPESRGSQTRRPAGPVDSSFLERMTRPTAASSNKFQKTEPAPKQLPHRTKVNGHPKGVKTASKDAVAESAGDTTAIEEPSISQEEAVENENPVSQSENMDPLPDRSR